MGLFDFIKDVANKAVGYESVDDAKVQQELEEQINRVGLNLQDFHLTFAKGVATLHGRAASQKDLELARLIIGNNRHVTKVNDDELLLATTAPVATPSAPRSEIPTSSAWIEAPATMVTVRPGDTLSKIALKYLGNASRYPEIFEANRPMVKDPNDIYPGQVLRIPKDQHSARTA